MEEKDKFFIEVETQPDKVGNQSFTVYWFDINTGKSKNEAGMKAQGFYTNLDEFIRNDIANNREMIIGKKGLNEYIEYRINKYNSN